MNTIFDPSILFMSTADDWKNPKKRDEFIKYLLDNLKCITEYCITQVYWTDELEEFLWNHPKLPPWRFDIVWKYQIIPQIYKFFSKCMKRIENFEEAITCAIQPLLSCICSEVEIHNSFLRLMHFLIKQEENVYFCAATKNRLPGNQRYTFYCECHSNRLKPLLICNPESWFNHIDVENSYWPSASTNEEIEKFKVALKITAKRDIAKDIDVMFVYEFEFDKQFIKEIIQEQKYRREILFNMSKRLLLNQNMASRDGGLKDEPVKSKQNVRRFRVTDENRIHYSYSGQKKILFLNYFCEGHHDKGL